MSLVSMPPKTFYSKYLGKGLNFVVKNPEETKTPSTCLSCPGKILPYYFFWLISDKLVHHASAWAFVDGEIAYGQGIRAGPAGQGYGKIFQKEIIYFLFEQLKIKRLILALSLNKKATENFRASLFLQLKYRMRFIGYNKKLYYSVMDVPDFNDLKEHGTIDNRAELWKIWKKALDEMKRINGDALGKIPK